ncbi:hypothetical protein LAL4801_06092 [Roseibium aggregatum]|jgi:hypothetical protein|uniref:Uncharacterized protein n=1 Tax=Roseibium aggregatum TaxID=187304 RepID=A0A0M6YFM1_9HYPH|nr:hypothetical protein LAL4801_06092 [Roseibium aggregatum]
MTRLSLLQMVSERLAIWCMPAAGLSEGSPGFGYHPKTKYTVFAQDETPLPQTAIQFEMSE